MATYRDLRGKVAIVTGAGQLGGKGAAICTALAAQGCDLLFTSWQAFDLSETSAGPDDPARLRERLQAQGVRAVWLDLDLAEPDTPERVLQETTEQFGPPSILVNNAAHSARDGFDQLDAETLDRHYAVNTRAPALLSASFAKTFRRGTGGRIVNITSGQELGPMLGELAYVASRGAVTAFTRTFAAEVAHLGITVNAVDPGPTDTGWMSEPVKAELLAGMRMGRLGQPEDAARLVTFLASEAASWITGQVIHSRGA